MIKAERNMDTKWVWTFKFVRIHLSWWRDRANGFGDEEKDNMKDDLDYNRSWIGNMEWYIAIRCYLTQKKYITYL